MIDRITELLAKIDAERNATPPEELEVLLEREREAQRQSFMRAMAPCEHGDPDWETCPQCLSDYANRKKELQ